MCCKYLRVSIKTLFFSMAICGGGAAIESDHHSDIDVECPKLQKVEQLIDFAQEWNALQDGRSTVEDPSICERFRESFLSYSCEFKVTPSRMLVLGLLLKKIAVMNEREFGYVDMHPLHRRGDAYENVDTLYFSWELEGKIGEIILKT